MTRALPAHAVKFLLNRSKSDTRSSGARKARHAGGSFEALILASANNSPLCLIQLPSAGGRFIGQGRFINEQIPCDFIGTCIGGRAVYFDAKNCGKERASLRCDDPAIVKPHQKDFLRRMASAGAIAGLLVRSERAGRYLWLPAEHIGGAVKWDASAWVDCGDTAAPVRFEGLVSDD